LVNGRLFDVQTGDRDRRFLPEVRRMSLFQLAKRR